MDVMLVLNTVQIIQNEKHMNRSARCTILVMQDDMEFPGFTRLRLIAEGDHEYIYTSPECFVETINGVLLLNISFIRKFIEGAVHLRSSVHGPCLSDKYETLDIAYCFHLHSWPRQAEQWIYRHRPGH